MNYQVEMEREIEQLNGSRPRLLLHSCCAPCSSAVLERLSEAFQITVFFYNPNISPESEYNLRLSEQLRLIEQMDLGIEWFPCEYGGALFEAIAKGREHEPEGGDRCELCFRLRLMRTAQAARDEGFDYFTTTLSVSPLKSAERLNKLGAAFSEAIGVKYLFSDFKKKNGYLRSCELSQVYGLYRQNYCGCRFSKYESYESLSPKT
jgi:predicted adenine nucleotide alpha hydrolase (AANH) superfamily ATPase